MFSHFFALSFDPNSPPPLREHHPSPSFPNPLPVLLFLPVPLSSWQCRLVLPIYRPGHVIAWWKMSLHFSYELAATTAALELARESLAASQKETETANARADEAWNSFLSCSLELAAEKEEALELRRHVESLASDLAYLRNERVAPTLRAEAAEVEAAECRDSASVLTLIAGAELRRQREQAHAELSALDAESRRAKQSAAALEAQLVKERAYAASLWELVQAQDATLRDLTAARMPA